MSFQAMTWATAQTCGSAAAKLVLLMLANHSNGHTGQCNPKHKLLAQECEMTVDTLKSHLKKLESLGLITIVPKFADGVQLPNQYILHLQHIEPEDLQGGGVKNYPHGGVKNSVGGGGKNYPPNNQEVNLEIETNLKINKSLQDDGNKLPISKKKSNITLKTFLEECQQKQERPLANYQGLTEYCKKVNLDMELVGLAWAVFKDRFLNITPNKKYADWRAAFLNYVKNDYLRLWYLDKDGNRQLTQAGQQAKQEHGA